jgi:hypothetical protein
MMWQSFLPFGLSVAICIFVSWKAAENQLELRESGSGRGGEGDDDEATAPAPRPGSHPKHRPPRTASEIRARLHTLSRLPPGPRRLARGRALALASERALREVSPPEEVGDGDGDGGGGDASAPAVAVESTAAAALRQTLPWLDARLAALASEDSRAAACGPCEICAGHEDACATHAWPCGGRNRGGGEGGGAGGGREEEGPSGGLASLRAALLGPCLIPPRASSSSRAEDPDSVYSTSLHRACGRCSVRCGARCPWCRREEGAPRLAFLEAAVY